MCKRCNCDHLVSIRKYGRAREFEHIIAKKCSQCGFINYFKKEASDAEGNED